VENDKKKEGQGSLKKSEGKSLGTTCCCQREERRQDGDRQEGTTKIGREEERGIYEETLAKEGDCLFFFVPR
jgi:hypothetical protein